MQKQIRIFLAGLMVVVPLAITVYVVWSVGAWLDGLVSLPLAGRGVRLPGGVGALIILAAIYGVGLLTHLWGFRMAFALIDRLLASLPGVKTLYESIRDLMKLFGGSAGQGGKVVRYTPPGSDASMLGILTNDRPAGFAGPGEADRVVAVYLPLSYMLGGPTIYVPPAHVRQVNLSVEQALKLAATAHLGAKAPEPVES